VSERVVVELPLCARVRDVHEPGKTSITRGETLEVEEYVNNEGTIVLPRSVMHRLVSTVLPQIFGVDKV
jgi:hypothetical protein